MLATVTCRGSSQVAAGESAFEARAVLQLRRVESLIATVRVHAAPSTARSNPRLLDSPAAEAACTSPSDSARARS